MTHDVRLPHLEQFLRGEAAQGKSPSTIRNHSMALARFGAWLANHNGHTAADLGPLQLDEYSCDLADHYPPDSANGHRSAVRLYVRRLHELGLRVDDPGRSMRFARPQPKPVESLTLNEVARLVAFARDAQRLRFGTYRSAVLVVFLIDTGARVGEALRLRLADLEPEHVLITASKTRNFRRLPIGPALGVFLSAYLHRRAMRVAGLNRHDSGALFCGEHGGTWSRGNAEAGCRTVGKLAGLERRLYPHLLRHTFATLSLINGAPLPAVMLLGGWRRLSTVQRYTQMSAEQLAQVQAASSPLGRASQFDVEAVTKGG